MAATVDDLALWLGLGSSIKTDRAQLLLDKATEMCESIVTPLPDGSDSVVLDVAGRAYVNPSNARFSAPDSLPPGSAPMLGGMWLTKANIAMLRRLSPGSGGGAFSIDPTPDDAGAGNFWPQYPQDPTQTWDQPPYYGDWDQIPSA